MKTSDYVDAAMDATEMNPDQYVTEVLKTESDYALACARIRFDEKMRYLHAGLGIATEAGEILDQLKKHVFYGKDLDTVNLVEEAGDLLWYIAILSDNLGVSLEKIMKVNIAKLRKRYGDKWSKDKALARDLAAERKVLSEGR